MKTKLGIVHHLAIVRKDNYSPGMQDLMENFFVGV